MKTVNCAQASNRLESGNMAIFSGTKRAVKFVNDRPTKQKDIRLNGLSFRRCLRICPYVILFFLI